MSLVIPPGFAQVAIEMRSDYDPDSWFTTWGIDLSATDGNNVVAAVSAAQAFEFAWQASLSNQVVVQNVILEIGQDGGPPFKLVIARGNRGAGSAEKLPQNCALLLDKFTERAGHSGRGRMFLPGILAEGQVSQTGIISSGEMSVYSIAATQFIEQLADPGTEGALPVPMVLLHSDKPGLDPTPDPVIFLSPQSEISTQRRRLRK